MENNLNQGISCNVKGCVFNEHGQGCNLDKVTISKGMGENHYCKSYIPLDDKDNNKTKSEKEKHCSLQNVENNAEYFNYEELFEEIEDKIED